ncbi:MAG: right-handed parallel beta-helix repeat-containing protein [Deltaproteobacteria bacterium]|nr:right-handed parallel beta-helix repeat-containing protein [Deltaproteobacteria bacterium]
MDRRAAHGFAALLTILAVLWATTSAHAQCDCDHTLDTSVTVANGDDLGVMPGDRVCVSSGARPFLRLNEFHGTAADPITILNCGGVVEISNPDRAYALVIEGESDFVRVTGTGDPEHEYGFRVSAPDREPYPGIGVWILGRATNIEVDHMEVFDTGFAGVMAKTDPSCDDRPFWDDFVMRDTRLHHLWVHDTGGEGFYIGSTQSAGYTRSCDGADVVIPAHRLEGVTVDHLLIENTGWDGIQIGFASDCTFTDSIVRHTGLERVEFQMQGVQLGGSICTLRRLDIRDTAAMGIIVLDASDVTIADTLIADVEADGIYLNLRTASAGRWDLVHNTITGAMSAGVRGFGDGQIGNATNNLVFGNAMGNLQLPRTMTSTTNVEVADATAAGIVGSGDYHLTSGSPARGAGTDLTSMGYAIDLDGRLRNVPPSVGAYEFAEDSPDAGVPIDAAVVTPPTSDAAIPPGTDAGPLPDTGPRPDGGTTTTPSSGCGCRVGSREPAAPLGVLVTMLAAVLSRRARRAAASST